VTGKVPFASDRQQERIVFVWERNHLAMAAIGKLGLVIESNLLALD
jgi:hypothetical protein